MTRDERILLAIQDPRFLSRFWAKVDKSGECWLWTATAPSGYGNIGLPLRLWEDGHRTAKAHRVSWMIHYGIPPHDTHCVCHACDVPLCVNPSHLWLGTNLSNNQDMVRKGRNVILRGDASANKKLSVEQVAEAKRLLAAGETLSSVATKFSVSVSAIWMIRKGLTWGYV